MHRSGTTVLTQALESLGLFVGYRLDDHHEARFFRRLNDWALRQANAAWDRPRAFGLLRPFQRENIERVFRLHCRGLRRVEYLGPWNTLRSRHLERLPFPWGWKDPRNTFLVPLWKRIFPNLKVVAIVRHPLDVAASLQKRAGEQEEALRSARPLWLAEQLLTLRPLYGESSAAFRIEEGLALWTHYAEELIALSEACGDSMWTLQFESLLDDPIRQLNLLADFLALEPRRGVVRNLARGFDRSKKHAFLTTPSLRQRQAALVDHRQAQYLGYSEAL